MYQSFFKLKRKPFSLIPNPDFLYYSKKHAIALSFLELSFMDESGIALITGEVGSGKTTLIRKLLSEVDDEHLSIGVISNTHKNFGDLLNWILIAFDLKPLKSKVEQYQQLVDFIAEEFNANRRVILIVDEAQNMSIDTLEELRLLSNVNIGEHILWQLVLVGQPELKKTLMMPELRQFSQRISLEYHLTALNYKETVEYIKYRLKVAGTEKNFFPAVSYAMIYYHSRGIPRIINNICELSLVSAYGNGIKTITSEIVIEVLRNKKVSQYQLSKTDVPNDAMILHETIMDQTGFDIADLTT